jgi:glycosyltransferase involved in cell wall biosynthesis
VEGLGVPRRKVIVQHNGVDGEEFAIRDRAEARRRVGVEHDRPIVLYVGNVKVGKGCKDLVEAMDPLVRRLGRDDVELDIVGSGDAQEALEARTRELGLEKNIRFRGRRLHTEVPLWMNACDVFCLASHMEGCPNVVLEALASGRPVVASRVGGIPELLDDDNGVLTPPRDPEGLARGLKEALERSWEPEKLRASVEYLSWEAVGDRYRDLLAEVLAEWRRGVR